MSIDMKGMNLSRWALTHQQMVGFLLVALFLGSLEVILDEGQRKDWFGSNLIVVFASLCAVSFLLMIPWELNHRNPVVDLKLLFKRQFGACFLVMMATGAILIGTLLDEMERQDKEVGYATLCVASGMGAGTIIERV